MCIYSYTLCNSYIQYMIISYIIIQIYYCIAIVIYYIFLLWLYIIHINIIYINFPPKLEIWYLGAQRFHIHCIYGARGHLSTEQQLFPPAVHALPGPNGELCLQDLVRVQAAAWPGSVASVFWASTRVISHIARCHQLGHSPACCLHLSLPALPSEVLVRPIEVANATSSKFFLFPRADFGALESGEGPWVVESSPNPFPEQLGYAKLFRWFKPSLLLLQIREPGLN